MLALLKPSVLRNWLKKIFRDECRMLVVKASSGQKSFRARFFEGEVRYRNPVVQDPNLKKLIFSGDTYVEICVVRGSFPHRIGLFVRGKPKFKIVCWGNGTLWDAHVELKKIGRWNPRRFTLRRLAACLRAAYSLDIHPQCTLPMHVCI